MDFPLTRTMGFSYSGAMITAPEIRKIRDQLGWSQQQLADYLHVHQSTVSLIERKDGPIKGPLAVLITQLAESTGAAQ